MNMAFQLARLSYAIRRKVGCLAVDFTGEIPKIVADGVNGTLPGEDNRCEDDQGLTKPGVIHAEINALNKLTCENKVTLFITVHPCPSCTDAIINSGKVNRVVYCLGYKVDNDKLSQAGIPVHHIPFSALNPDLDLNEIDFSSMHRSIGFPESVINKAVVDKLNQLRRGE